MALVNAKAALHIADRGYVLETGKVIVQGPASDLPANQAVQRAYLGGRNLRNKIINAVRGQYVLGA